MEFFLNVFTEVSEFSDKNICLYSKRIQTCHLLCKRPGCYHSASKTHVGDRIFKLRPIYASVIFNFPKFAEFSEISALFRKISILNSSYQPVKTLGYTVCSVWESFLLTGSFVIPLTGSGSCNRLCESIIDRVRTFYVPWL